MDDDAIQLRSPIGTANRFQHPFTMTIVGQTMSGKLAVDKVRKKVFS